MKSINSINDALPEDMDSLTELEIKQPCPVDRAYQLVEDYPKLATLRINGSNRSRQEIKQLPFGSIIRGGGVDRVMPAVDLDIAILFPTDGELIQPAQQQTQPTAGATRNTAIQNTAGANNAATAEYHGLGGGLTNP